MTDVVKGKLHISWPLTSFKGTMVMDLDGRGLQMKIEGDPSIKWFLDLTFRGCEAESVGL